jgi:hypothetical protein
LAGQEKGEWFVLQLEEFDGPADGAVERDDV